MAPSRLPLFPKQAAAFVRDPEALAHLWTHQESEDYTRWLSTNHYENFHVVSFLLPKELHQDFYNVYAFCRWADDLGDEIGDTAECLRLLAWWRGELANSRSTHPVFVALRGTIERRRLPQQLFADLITAFEQDQVKTRYANWAEIEQYCVYSANPVGRLVLALCGYHDEERGRLSDFTCTGLQLANFWQDVKVDLEKDRVYLPQDLLARHGVAEEQLFARRQSEGFVNAMQEATAYARSYFKRGLPLIPTLDRRLALDIELFSQGGLAILDKIGQQGYTVLEHRPKIGKLERVGLLVKTLVSWGAKGVLGG